MNFKRISRLQIKTVELMQFCVKNKLNKVFEPKIVKPSQIFTEINLGAKNKIFEEKSKINKS